MHRIEQKMIAGLVLISALLASAGNLFLHSAEQSVVTLKWVSHSYSVIAEIKTVLSLLKEVESGQRGYIITGEPAYLESYTTSSAEIGQHVELLKLLTADNSHQQTSLRTATPLIEQRLALLGQVIKIRQQDGFLAAQQIILTGQGRKLMGKLWDIFTQMNDEEQVLLKQRTNKSVLDYQHTMGLLTLLSLMTVGLLVLIYLLIHRYVHTQHELKAALQQLATHDELTGLYNRRELNRRLEEELVRYRRHQHSFALLLLDIDHFKTVNDSYGHPAGDQVLQWFGQHLLATLRDTDVPARFGGEELAIILPESTLEAAFEVAERIRLALAEHLFIVGNPQQEQQFSVTVSTGISLCSARTTTIATLLEAADQALYQAKHAGRNRCQAAP